VAESTNYVPTAIYAAPMLDTEGEVLGVVSVLDPVVDEASDWTLDVLGAIAGLMALLTTATAGTSEPPERLARLGSDVLRVVASWQSGEPGHQE
jgi:hypothetical protein